LIVLLLNLIYFHPPKNEGIKRSYLTKEKPVKFPERANISYIETGDINSSLKPVNFQTFMAILKSKE